MKQCPNCEQPVVTGDVTCWHCGWRLAANGVTIATTDSVTPASPLPVIQLPQTTVLVYVGMAAAVILAALAVTVWLGRYPLVQVGSAAPLRAGWRHVTDAGRRFTFDAPEGWQTWDPQNEEQQADLETLLQTDRRYEIAFRPLSDAAADMEIIYLAASTAGQPPPAFLVVGRSSRLNNATAEQAIASVEQSGLDVLAAGWVEDFDKSHAAFTVEIPAGGGDLRCHQQLILGEAEALLAAGCAPPTEYARYRPPLEAMMASFQRLRK